MRVRTARTHWAAKSSMSKNNQALPKGEPFGV